MTGAGFQCTEEKFCVMISKHWLVGNSFLHIDYWKQMRCHLSLPPSPLPHLVKVFLGGSAYSWWENPVTLELDLYTWKFCIFPQSFASSHQSWPETAADPFCKCRGQRFLCAMVYDNYLLGLKVRSPNFFLCVSESTSKYRKTIRKSLLTVKSSVCVLKLTEKQKFNLTSNDKS